MKEKNINAKRLIAELLLAGVIALLFYSFQIHSKSYSVYLEVSVLVAEDDHYQIFYTDSNAYNQEHSLVTAVSKKEGYQKIYFVLPKDSTINTFRFDPGNKAGQVRIQEIKIMVSGKEIVWKADQIVKAFIPNAEIDRFEWRDSTVVLHSKGNDPHLFLQKGIRKEYQDLCRYAEVQYKILPAWYSLAAFVLLFIGLRISGKLKNGFFQKAPDRALVYVFFILISMPLLNMMFELVPETENHEKRNLVAKPVYHSETIYNYPQQFTTYFNDQFGFRSLLIKLNSYFKIGVFRTSPIPEKVLIGKDNWLFLSSFGDPMLSAEPLFKEEEINNLKKDLEQRSLTLKKSGIDYYVLITPDKSLIYPEYLPAAYRSRNTNARMDQFFSSMRENKNINCIDVRAALTKAKPDRDLYYSSDTHWNIYAAMIAYEELMRTLQKNHPELSSRPVSDFEFILQEEAGGDLCDLFNTPELYTKRVWLPRVKGEKMIHNMRGINPDYHKKFTHYNPDSLKTKKILFYHDSFGLFFIKPASDDFREITFSWTPDFSYKDIEEHKPDIVIHEVVSRFIPSLIDK